MKRYFHRPSERGQGLAEYALILVLVGVVVIIVLATQGKAVANVFCDVAINLGAKATDSIQACASPRVLISGVPPNPTPRTLTIEALVKDNKGNMEPNITKVIFSVSPSIGGWPRQENNYKYCFNGDNDHCNTYTFAANTTYTITAVATDLDTNTGSASITFTTGGS